MKLLQSVGLEGGGRAVVCFMSQVVLNTVETDAAGCALVVVGERQGWENAAAAAAAAAAVPWSLSETGPLAQVDWAISFGT